ncbi:MAG TPA: hypothetical protein VN742_01575, partial [Candidatus Binataceae bacterium]|nr:hypothetical protein [Candidatus Binataceae bacterium]
NLAGDFVENRLVCHRGNLVNAGVDQLRSDWPRWRITIADARRRAIGGLSDRLALFLLVRACLADDRLEPFFPPLAPAFDFPFSF